MNSCVNKEPLRDPVCSYQPIQESELERSARMGDVSCNEVIPGHNNSFENRINVLFIGLNYGHEQFLDTVYNSTDCTRLKAGILSHTVFSDNMDRFNFWYQPNMLNFIPSDEGYVTEENEPVNLSNISSEMSSSCNGINTRLDNFAPIILAADKFRSHASYSPLMSFNFDGHYNEISSLKINLETSHVNEPACQDFVASCHLIDNDNDGSFTEADWNIIRNYSDNEIQEMCTAIHTTEECNELSWREIIEDYSEASRNYGFLLCKTFAETSIESTAYPSDALCEVVYGALPKLGTSVVSSKRYIPKIVCHEIGHSIFALRDEYVESSRGNIYSWMDKLQRNGANCFIGTYGECMENSNWSNLENTDCYEGCSYVSHGVFRPTENSLMRDSSSNSYGAYNESRICEIIKLLTGNADGICRSYIY